MFQDSTILGQLIVALIGVVAGGILTWISVYLKTRQGNRVIVYRISESPQINISNKVRINLEVKYKDLPVDNLVLNTLRIENQGTEIISPMAIEVNAQSIGDEIKFLEIQAEDPLDKTLIKQDGNKFSITRDFLNPKRAYKEEIVELAIFSNTKLSFSIKGGGKGWYGKFVEKEAYALEKTMIVPSMVFFFSLLGSGLLLLVFIAGTLFGDGPKDFLNIFVNGVILLVPVTVMLYTAWSIAKGTSSNILKS